MATRSSIHPSVWRVVNARDAISLDQYGNAMKGFMLLDPPSPHLVEATTVPHLCGHWYCEGVPLLTATFYDAVSSVQRQHLAQVIHFERREILYPQSSIRLFVFGHFDSIQVIDPLLQFIPIQECHRNKCRLQLRS